MGFFDDVLKALSKEELKLIPSMNKDNHNKHLKLLERTHMKKKEIVIWRFSTNEDEIHKFPMLSFDREHDIHHFIHSQVNEINGDIDEEGVILIRKMIEMDLQGKPGYVSAYISEIFHTEYIWIIEEDKDIRMFPNSSSIVYDWTRAKEIKRYLCLMEPEEDPNQMKWEFHDVT